MLRASAPITTQGATVAMQAAGPLKRLLPGDRIMLISATTGTVANPGSHILEYGAYRYLFDVQSASALTATLASTNLTLAANKLYPALSAPASARWPTAAACCRPPTCAAPSGAACSSVRTWATPATPTRTSSWTAPTPCSATPWRRHRRWRLRGGAAGRGRAHPLSRPGFVGRPVGRGQGPRRQRRRGHPGALLVPGRHVCRGLAAQRTHARQLYRRHRRQHQLPQSFELLGPTPCWAM